MNEAGQLETWEYQGGTFTDIESWIQIGSSWIKSKFDALGVNTYTKSSTAISSGAVDLRCFDILIKKGALIRFKVEVMEGDTGGEYMMLTYIGRNLFSQVYFTPGEEYILPVVIDITESELEYGAYFPADSNVQEARFEGVLNYQASPEYPAIDRLPDRSIDSKKLADEYINLSFDNFILKPWGYFCDNVNSGSIIIANDTYNGYLAQVTDKLKYIIEGVSEYAFARYYAFCYSDLPSVDTASEKYLGAVTIVDSDGAISLKEGTRFIAITVKQTSITTDRVRLYSSRKVTTESIADGAVTYEKLAMADEIKAFGEVLDVPNNHKYIKNWDVGNKLVTRLYVENKSKALEDGLYIKAFFHKLNNDRNCGINFGTQSTSWAVTIAPNLGEFESYEMTNATYGKIAIKMKWDAIEWSGSSVNIPVNPTESNLEDIVFDYSEFDKPEKATVEIVDGQVTEEKLSEDVREKLNGQLPALAGYELFSLGDSLSSSGTWQEKVAEITGCLFDQGKNEKAGAALSVGGTKSFGQGFDNMVWRAKNLVDMGYISGEGENAIIVLENVNDAGMSIEWDPAVRTIIPTSPIEGYDADDFNSEFLASISEEKALNACLRLAKANVGTNLAITALPSKEGDVTLTVGWAGPGNKNYNIHVVPQSNDEDTRQFILDKILEYDYTGVTDSLADDGVSVNFSNTTSSDPKYKPSVVFADTSGTGMQVSITDTNSAKSSIAKYFIGDTVDDWTDESKWLDGNDLNFSMGWKATIELLQRSYPKAHIFVSMFPLHSATAADFLLPTGAYDTYTYSQQSRVKIMNHHQEVLKSIANFYSLPFINVYEHCGIGISNMLTYYNAQANVHPKNEGYIRFGETVASMIKGYL